MTIVTLLIGLGIVGLGAGVWRYEWIHLLSNVDASRVDEAKKGALARYAGRYLILVGIVVLMLALLSERMHTERALLGLVLGAVALIVGLTGLYLWGLRRFMTKK